jgi:PhnO protein
VFEIRMAELFDYTFVYSLLCELEEQKLDHIRLQQIYEDNLADPCVFYFVATVECEVVGFASLHIQKLLHHAGLVGEIQELIVKDDCRGQGIGTSLIRKVTDQAKKAGCIQLEVCCNQKRLSSHRFYQAHGMDCSHYKFTMPLK